MASRSIAQATAENDPVTNAPVSSVVDSFSAPDQLRDVVKEQQDSPFAADAVPQDLKKTTTRGALVSSVGQVATFAFRMVSMVSLARLLAPKDFGLVAMATACTGFLGLFQDIGLSSAAIQRPSLSHAQASALFWINLCVGGLLAAFCAATAPILARFYNEPRVLSVTVVVGCAFLFNGAAAQHRAMLQRKLRFKSLTLIDTASVFLSIVISIAMAVAGLGYWALVGMLISAPIIVLTGVWIVGPWVPGPPRRGTGVGSMLRYGGTVMLDNIIMYFAYNMDKVLLGRFCGAQALGLYSRAYQLINMPTQNLNTAVSLVAFPALSRLQSHPERLRSYFLKGYTLFLGLVMPITAACGLFGEDIIRVFLGPKWVDAAPIFRLMAPTIFAFALINPTGWLLLATGRVFQSLMIGLVIAPVVMLGYFCGIGYGPIGVATGFSVSMLVLIGPTILWGIRGTPVNPVDILHAIRPPLYSVLVASAAALICSIPASLLSLALLRLFVVNAVLFGGYAAMLWFVMGQKELYLSVLHGLGFKTAR